MLTHDEIKGIVKTITDGLKDADMHIEWAEEAKEAGNHELTSLHINEAKKRLDGAKEWYDKAMAMHTEEKHTPLEEILICHYMIYLYSFSTSVRHWYHEMREEIEKFHK